MSEPYKTLDGWFVELDEPGFETSGPWNSEAAAFAAGCGNFTLAHTLHNKSEPKVNYARKLLEMSKSG